MCWTVGYWITDSFCCWVGPQVVDQTGEFTDRFSNGFCMFLCAFVRVMWVIWVICLMGSHLFAILRSHLVAKVKLLRPLGLLWASRQDSKSEISGIPHCFSLFLNSVFQHIFLHIFLHFPTSLKSQGGIQSVGLKVGDAWRDLKLHGRAQSSKAGHV
jgi:hypothetical protein